MLFREYKEETNIRDMIIPSEFRIGGVKYSVEVVEHIRDDHSGGLLYGYHDQITANIKVAKNVSSSKVNEDLMTVTFFHELLHAMVQVIGYNFPTKEDEENMIDRLAYMFNEFEQSKRGNTAEDSM